MEKMKSRKLWLSIMAALLPLLAKHFFPDLPTEIIITSVVGVIAGVMGISMEDVAKQKRAALEAAASQGKKSSD
jgi:F0F1-type ATP synthase assembly protein I